MPAPLPYDRAVFSEADRDRVREQLVEAARANPRIAAAAIVGSAAAGRADEWSDIDLALRLGPGLTPADAIDAWTELLYHDHGAVGHFDLWSGSALYRVFLLASTLQVDVSLWPYETFVARGAFQLLFGEAGQAPDRAPPSAEPIIGLGWISALHARTSIARGRPLQALYWLNGMRDQLVSLACLRHGLPEKEGRGVDQLPDELRRQLAGTIVRSLDPAELVRALALLVDALIGEIRAVDEAMAERLTPVLLELAGTARARA
jgi:predicted nucleotidyltransferase